MAYTAYDWQQTLAEKADYADSRLQNGSPVVAVSYDEGILFLTMRKGQGKLFEVYDRLAMGALGNPSDLEAVRQFAVDFSHREGYQRSSEDVSVQRVVGFAISPAFKKAFSDPRTMPIVLKAVFGQLGETAEDDVLLVLGYDGEFHHREGVAFIAGNNDAQQRMDEVLKKPNVTNQKSALELALKAWVAGYWRPGADGSDREHNEDEILLPPKDEHNQLLREMLEDGSRIEAVLLERDTQRERKYRLIDADAIKSLLPN
jgi:proteasome alpha subunit